MADETTTLPSRGQMSHTDFRKFAELIHGSTGIHLAPCKKFLLESRFRKRLKALGMQSFREYSDYVFSTEGRMEELVHLIDVVTTNKTDFFREPEHFRFLVNRILEPRYGRAESYERFHVWSAACSSGEEPYTLAMVLDGFALQHAGFTYSLLATDVSTDMLDKARMAVYDHSRVEAIPPDFRQKYLMRSKNYRQRLYRIVPEIREKVRFQHLNLTTPDPSFNEKADVIFCRNVLIYFDRPVQEKVLRFLCRRLKPGGYLFVGHSETLTGLDLPLVHVAPTTYRGIHP